MRLGILAAASLLLAACAEEKQSQIPLYEVNAREFSIQVQGFGEIEAAQAERIITPGTQPMTLSWLAPENTLVKKGDVVAKFDAERILKDSRTEELAMLALSQDIEKSMAALGQQKADVRSEQQFVQEEFAFVDKFAIDDLRLYSKLEILDTMQNRDFLDAKEDFLGWKEGSIGQQHDSEMAVLNIKKGGHEAKFKRFQDALSKLQVYAPYDGLLVFEKDGRGEKPTVGQTFFPGRPIAKIPNLDNMQAKVYVLANEAIDLAAEQKVDVRLDAYPDKVFQGEVKQVAGFPRSIERGNPVKYYEVTVGLTEQDKQLMQPGRKVSVTVHVNRNQDKLLVPLQAIHHDQGRSFVYIKSGGEFNRQDVKTQVKNQFFVEVVDGLQEGDQVALSAPAGEV